MGYLSKTSKEEFRKLLKDWTDKNDPDATRFPDWMRKEFWQYWVSKNEGGRLMYFQMEKKWNTGLRLATWKRNSQRDPRWREIERKAKEKPSTVYPGSFFGPRRSNGPESLMEIINKKT